MNRISHEGDARSWAFLDLIEKSLIDPGDTRPRCVLTPSKSVSISALCDDSRQVTPGACFVAVRGTDFDGHDFVADAMRRGAAAVIVEHDLPVEPPIARVLVSDTRGALARLAGTFFEINAPRRPRLRLLGVTGTNGKSTTAWFLRSILKAQGSKTAMLGTIEYDLADRHLDAPLTTPGPIELCRHLSRAATVGAKYGVLEVSSHALDQRRTDGLDFEAAVFTNLSGDHLDYHKTTEAYLQSKCRLFANQREDAWAVVNLEDPVAEEVISSAQGRVRTFALDHRSADFHAEIVEADIHGTDAIVFGKKFRIPVRVKLPGRYNVSNALAAAAAASLLDVDHEAIREGIEGVAGVPGRLQSASAADCPFTVLVDYAHTDDALAHALNTLAPLTRGRLICVFGCGGDRDRTKRPRMAAIADQLCDVAWVTSDNPRHEAPQAIVDDIVTGFAQPPQCSLHVEVDRHKAIQGAIESALPGDTILIAGKGHETIQQIGDTKLNFDDVAVAKACARSHVPASEVVV